MSTERPSQGLLKRSRRVDADLNLLEKESVIDQASAFYKKTAPIAIPMKTVKTQNQADDMDHFSVSPVGIPRSEPVYDFRQYMTPSPK